MAARDAAALESRLRVIETIATGQAPARYDASKSITRRADEATTAFRTVVETPGNEPIRRFVDGYEANAALLRTPLPTDGLPIGDEPMPSNETKAIMVLEAEADLRSVEKDLRELEALDKRDLAGAGTLGAHESLQQSLQQLRAELPAVARSYSALEDRLTTVLEHYNAHISNVSELFISFNSVISQAEETVRRLERAKDA